MGEPSIKTAQKNRRYLWLERGMAILALANFGLVLFDLSYVTWRNFYFRRLPGLTQVYDRLKAIEPHRETQEYLDTVEQLRTQVSQTGLRSPEVEKLLQRLRVLSTEMIQNNPFAVANKTGTLEKIKNIMRGHIGNKSSTQSFQTFWSVDYLTASGWEKQIAFYNREIEPLIATNYFRQIGEDGEFIDDFWKIDIWFIIIFLIDFLARTYGIHRSHKNLTWREAMLWRWYDLLLLLPFWRLLRSIPVVIRLHEAKLINLNTVQTQINHQFVATLAEEITEVVVLQVLNQAQNSIRRGEIIRLVLGSMTRPYVDINQVNEVEAIGNLLVKLLVYRVFPKIQPDIEAILQHSVQSILAQSPAYRKLQQLPGIGQLPSQSIERLVNEVSQSAYKAIIDTLEDPVGIELSGQLVQHFSETLVHELQREQTLETIQSLLSAFIEEIKINYIKRFPEQDFQAVLEQTRQIRQMNDE
ncbi:MAG: hypothetical protein KME17_30145 [Cyanosarcina radialis HA8281-LM2]|jgi:hypothetical protein|nr:hypothetical protein [Cyanosarcina radialis HA8281-LM2]